MRPFRFSILITAAVVVAVGWTLGVGAALITAILIAIEITFSLDNAVINARVLERLDPFWRQLFMTAGLLIGIVVMRAIFPVLVVMLSAHLPLHQVVNEALRHPAAYSRHLAAAQPSIAAFGGSFLLTLALYFLMDDERDEIWLKRVEKPFQAVGGSRWLPTLTAAIVVVILALLARSGSQVWHLGLLGVAGYTLLKFLIDGLDRLEPSKAGVYTGWLAFGGFLYLELLDASFSFDSVLGAFAITNRVVLIVLGLGVGALWVRTLTVIMVRRGTLKSYKYLEHGAHYAILVLAAALLASLFHHVPDAITGVAGLGVIAASFQASRQANRTGAAKQ